MKKLLLLFAATLPCFLAHSQEAEGTGRYAEFQLIPRTEFNAYFAPGNSDDGSSGFNFGSTSIYTLLEGAFSKNVSFTLSNHWAAMTTWGLDDTANLYKSTLYSNTNNWLDIATVGFSFGDWTFTIGKDCIASGGFEYDDWDVDVDYLLVDDVPLLVSNLWYNLPSYQWGAKVGYSFGEHTDLTLQMVTSPFGERPFASGLFCYSGKLVGSYGPYSNSWSASAVQRPDGGFEWLITLANNIEFADVFTVGFDWYNIADVDFDLEGSPCEFIKGNTFRPTFSWAPEDWFDCKVVANIYERGGELYDLNVGSAYHFHINDFLQANAAVGWDLFTKSFAVMAGVKANITLFSL